MTKLEALEAQMADLNRQRKELRERFKRSDAEMVYEIQRVWKLQCEEADAARRGKEV